jgi:hypothetical protein
MSFAVEVNFDGLIGPSHNYGGLSDGNLASARNAGDVSNPREAAVQGLEKMRTLLRAGLVQGVLPPLGRPNFDLLSAAGFSGTDAQMIDAAARTAPRLLKAAYSASSMWTANAATVSPSADTGDGRCTSPPPTCRPCSTAAWSTLTRRPRSFPSSPARSISPCTAPCRRIRTLPTRARPIMSVLRGAWRARRRAFRVRTRGRRIDRWVSGAPDTPCVGIHAPAHGLDAARTVFARQARPGHRGGRFP